MAAPVSSGQTVWNNGTTPKTISVTVPANGLVVVVGVTEDDSQQLATPTGGGLTYTLQRSSTAVDFTPTYLWTATSPTAQTFTLSVARAGSSTLFFGFAYLVYAAGSTIGASNIGTGTSGASTISLTTTAASSGIACVAGDWSALTGTATMSSASATPTVLFTNQTVNYGAYVGHYADAGAAGAKTVGWTAPNNMKRTVIALEVIPPGGANLTDTPADNVGVTDSVDAVGDDVRTPADQVDVTDSPTTAATRDRSVTDAVGVSDGVATERALVASDSVGVTDSVAIVWSRTVSIDEPVGITDSVTAQGSGGQTQTPADSVAAADSLGVEWTRAQAPGDPVGVTDSVAITWSRSVQLGDSVGLTDSLSSNQTGTGDVTLDDPVGVTDSASADAARLRSVSDPVGVTDQLQVSFTRTVTISDPVGATDSASDAAGLDRQPADSVGVTDVLTVTFSRASVIADNVGIYDSLGGPVEFGKPGPGRLVLTVKATVLRLSLPPSSNPSLVLAIPLTRLEVDAVAFHVGDTAPPITGTILEQGAPKNLTGASIMVHVKRPSGTVMSIAGSTGGADGTWSANWPAAITEEGTHEVEVQVTFSGGAVQTFGPTTFYVYPQLA